jgi:hypothetical protein
MRSKASEMTFHVSLGKIRWVGGSQRALKQGVVTLKTFWTSTLVFSVLVLVFSTIINK